MVLHSVQGPAGDDFGDGADGDAGFFEMSPASAEPITMQISSMMDRAWEYVAIAYQGRAHIALGYASWDEHVDDRLSDLRLTVPRQERGAVVRSLPRAQMSLRAIAKVLGVDVATVHRSLGATEPVAADSAEEPAPIRGREGKQYPRRRRPAVGPCSICGEVHDGDPDECPWDLFAQGLGSRKGRQEGRTGASVAYREREEVVDVKVPSGRSTDRPIRAARTGSACSRPRRPVQRQRLVGRRIRARAGRAGRVTWSGAEDGAPAGFSLVDVDVVGRLGAHRAIGRGRAMVGSCAG